MKHKTIIFFIALFIPVLINAEGLADNAKSAILMEYTTGKILFEKNANERLPMASMTKIMTLLLTMDAISEGKVSYDDLVTISANASSMGGSQMFLEANTQVKLGEIIKGVSIASANDGAVALAEYIGGSTEKFVEMMNNKAKELGLENTNFANPHGLDSENHYSSAYDMAIMALNLINHKDILNYTSIYEDYFNKPDGSRTWLVNTNKLVRFYKGVDGLKTGYTQEAGYCLTTTAERDNIRFITVLMREPTSDLRSKETTNLLNYAFNSFKLNNILNENSEIGTIDVEKGNIDKATLIPKKAITELISKNDSPKEYSYNININRIIAPVKSGDIVGNMDIIDNEGLIVRTEEITIKENILKANIWQMFQKNLRVLVCGK